MTKKPHKNPIFPVRLSKEHLTLLDQLAAKTGVTRTDIIRMAIVEYAKRYLTKL